LDATASWQWARASLTSRPAPARELVQALEQEQGLALEQELALELALEPEQGLAQGRELVQGPEMGVALEAAMTPGRDPDLVAATEPEQELPAHPAPSK